jgi:hypothetical protein
VWTRSRAAYNGKLILFNPAALYTDEPTHHKQLLCHADTSSQAVAAQSTLICCLIVKPISLALFAALCAVLFINGALDVDVYSGERLMMVLASLAPFVFGRLLGVAIPLLTDLGPLLTTMQV